MKTTTRSRTATIRISPSNLAAAEKVAALTGRTVSSLTEYALALFIQKNYPMAYNPNAVLELRLDEAPKLSNLGRVAVGEPYKLSNVCLGSGHDVELPSGLTEADLIGGDS